MTKPFVVVRNYDYSSGIKTVAEYVRWNNKWSLSIQYIDRRQNPRSGDKNANAKRRVQIVRRAV